MSQFMIGNYLRFSVTITLTETGALTDVDELVLTIRRVRSAVEAIYTLSLGEITHDGLGLYHCNHLPEQAVKYYYRWESSGTVITAEEDDFTMLKSSVI